MPNESALSLYQLMGAPLQALVEGESNAAFATAKFIKEVGFWHNPERRAPEGIEEFGDLRMVTFRHDRIDADGKKRAFKVQVPLLSLVPIPALQIKDADLEFFVRIVDDPKVSEKIASKGTENKFCLREGSAPPQRELKGRFGRVQHDVSRKGALDMQIRVRIKMEQADVPAGLGRLFNLMAENVSVNEEKA